jgi:MFS transporter, ACS family, hexuronate transporter
VESQILSRRQAWALTLVATLTMAISYIDRQTLAVLAPTVTAALGISEVSYGWLASAFSIAYLVGAPLAGRLIDRVGARRGLPAAVLVWTAVAAAHAVVPGFGALFALRIALGLAEAPSFPAAAQTVHRALPPAERSRGLGVLFTGSSIGAMVAPKLATTLQAAFDWRFAFLGSALAGLVWLPIWLTLTSSPAARAALDRDDTEARAQSAGRLGARLWIDPAVLRAVGIVLASAPAIAFVLIWGSKYLVSRHGVHQRDVGNYLWLPPLLFDLGAIAFGDLATRRQRARAATGDDGSPHRFLMATAALLASSLALVPLANTAWSAVAIEAISMAGGGGLYALATADMMGRVSPAAVSQSGGITAAAQSLTHIVIHPLIGRHLDESGSYTAVLVALGAWVLPFSALWIIHTPPPLHRTSPARQRGLRRRDVRAVRTSGWVAGSLARWVALEGGAGGGERGAAPAPPAGALPPAPPAGLRTLHRGREPRVCDPWFSALS